MMPSTHISTCRILLTRSAYSAIFAAISIVCTAVWSWKLCWSSVAVIVVFLPSQGLYQGGFAHHLAINGKSFAALCDHFPEYVPKVK